MATATPNWSKNVSLAGTLATPQTFAHGVKVNSTLDRAGSSVDSSALGSQARRERSFVANSRVGAARGSAVVGRAARRLSDP
jgi:hypothetical protein